MKDSARTTPPREYDLDERVERLETLLSYMVIHGDNIPSFDNNPGMAREILTEIKRELKDAEGA